MTYSIIQKSQLEGAKRLDAEYYQPEYLEKVKKLGLFPTVNLGDIAFITDGEHGSPIFNEESGIKYFSAQHVKDGYIDPTNAQNISKIIDERNERSRLKEGDILLSTVGTIGFAGLVTTKLLPANIDRHVARIALKEKTLESEFLIAFLNSSYGKFQSIRESTGNVQLNLFLNKIREFKVPKNNNSRISKLIKEALKELENSEKIYSHAENLLLEKLKLKDFKIDDGLAYVVNFFDLKSTHRADAEYFQPKYEKIFDCIKAPIKKLNEITKFLNHAKQPPYIENGEIPIITQKHLGKVFLNLDAINNPETKFTSAEWIKKYPEYRLKAGDVLYYSVGAYIGKTNIVFEGLNATAASFITIIRLKKEINPVYLTVVLNSIIGQLQSEKWQSATAQQYIYPKDIKNFKIPLLPKPTQQKIADLVQKSHQARKKAKELLEEAKLKVEDLIKKGGN